jgi:serine kinase of HPr protein (carbohydrate metabolism regulator)
MQARGEAAVERGAIEVRIHGTAVCLGTRAAILRGPSGAGKSDLALRCLNLPASGAAGQAMRLVADDQVIVRTTARGLEAAPPRQLEGLLEVRGLGVIRIPFQAPVSLSLLVDLVTTPVERLPDPWPTEDIAGIQLPILKVAAFEASTAGKVALALAAEPWGAT